MHVGKATAFLRVCGCDWAVGMVIVLVFGVVFGVRFSSF